MSNLRVTLALAAAALLSLGGCLGGSDGVENPKLAVDLRPDDGSAAIAGRVALYEKDRDPVKDSVPLLAKDFSGAGRVAFTPEDLDGALALRTHFGQGNLPDTSVDFNLVASSGDREAFVIGYRYKRAGGRAGFSHLPADAKPSDGGYGAVSEVVPLPKAVTGLAGKVGGQGLVLGLDYVFVPGSPYHGAVVDFAFVLPRLSPGTYGLLGADRDSSRYFESLDSLNTADTAFTAKAWDVITFIPK